MMLAATDTATDVTAMVVAGCMAIATAAFTYLRTKKNGGKIGSVESQIMVMQSQITSLEHEVEKCERSREEDARERALENQQHQQERDAYRDENRDLLLRLVEALKANSAADLGEHIGRVEKELESISSRIRTVSEKNRGKQ